MHAVPLPYLNQKRKLTALSRLIQRPWSIFLDSAGTDHHFNQYDIFCCEPEVTLSFNGNQANIQSKYQLPSLDLADPIGCLRSLLSHFSPKKSSDSFQLPFNGGWMGYISYDFARHLEQLPELTKDDIELPQIQMGLYRWALITDHHKKTTHLYNFGLNTDDWHAICQLFNSINLEPINPEESSLEKNLSNNQSFNLINDWKSNTSFHDYENAFKIIHHYIQAGDCYQINYAQRFTAQYKGSPFAAYQQLTQANQTPFSAYLNFTDHQILSLSPERFIKSHQGKITTQPIKGTRPRHHDPIKDQLFAEELKKSEKDKAENLMIVDLLRNDLSKTANKASVKVKELFTHYQFESVHHLISTIESQLSPQYDNFDLLQTAFPGGSITGAPKIRAMQIIEELEPVRRNLYCGMIGYLDFLGNMDTNICIRTLIAKDKNIHCWAGGGLVADSKVDIEYRETFDKLAKILPVLNKSC